MTTPGSTTDPAREIRDRYASELAAGATVDTAAWRAVHHGESAACASLRAGLIDDARAWADAAEELYQERVA